MPLRKKKQHLFTVFVNFHFFFLYKCTNTCCIQSCSTYSVLVVLVNALRYSLIVQLSIILYNNAFAFKEKMKKTKNKT